MADMFTWAASWKFIRCFFSWCLFILTNNIKAQFNTLYRMPHFLWDNYKQKNTIKFPYQEFLHVHVHRHLPSTKEHNTLSTKHSCRSHQCVAVSSATFSIYSLCLPEETLEPALDIPKAGNGKSDDGRGRRKEKGGKKPSLLNNKWLGALLFLPG